MHQEGLVLKDYKIGQIVDYKIRQRFTNCCELIDEKTNITSYLHGTDKLVLYKGQAVKCRVSAIGEKRPKIELVNIEEFEQSKDNLTEEKFAELLAPKAFSWNTKEFVKLVLTEENIESFESQSHRWIQNLLNKKIDLQTVRQDCSDLLELSEFLNICSHNERDFYQERLTLLIEQMGYYIKAEELIRNEAIENAPNLFIDNLFNKLRISGFVYHPIKNFNILSCLFFRKAELMNNRMKELLKVICDKDIQIWQKEPFCSALIKLLGLYIRECDGKIDKTKDNKELIDNNMLALEIQLLLMKDAKESDIADYRLSTAKLCILSSYLYTSDPAKLINAAYYNLFHSNAILPLHKVEDVNLLPHYIANSTYDDIDTVNSFSHRNGRLVISKNKIHLQSVKEKGDLRPVFPKSLELWKDMQVFLPYKTETNLTSVKPNDITPYQSVWAEIEQELFNAAQKIPTTFANKNKKQHRVDDLVKITIISQDIDDRNKYYCQIEDETGGNGFIYVKDDIVPYPVQTSLRHFYASDGSRLVFQAQIIDKEDDSFHFSMSKELKDFVSDDYYSDDEDIICSVGAAPNSRGMSAAITTEGVSVSIENAGDFDGIDRNTIVRCRFIGPGPDNYHIRCEMMDYASYDYNLSDAFKKLLNEYRIDKIPENIEQQEEGQIEESDRLIDESYVREVIYMIDRMALIDTEYVKSYNYLGFARILCLLIGWESQAAYYKGRMDIIVMLHDFAQNSKVDEEKLTQLADVNAELFASNIVLRERFMQLQTVSFMGKNEHNTNLFNLTDDNSSLKSLASLVLAYNITKTNKLESCAIDIHNKIMQQLNLKGYETGLKLYGTGKETEKVEYKTSIVFYAGSISPNPQKQMEEILRVINSFLNTRGGTLYIGVNNSGYGVGIEDDLKVSPYYGDKEKYIRSIVDAVALEWGNNIATTYIKRIDFDEENTDKDVVIVEISPIPTGLPYKDDWYVRTAGTKRKLTQTEYNEYQKVNRRLSMPIVIESIVGEKPEPNQELINMAKPLITMKDDEIKTSRIRKNVLEEYEDLDNYVEPISYFKFMSGNKFKKLENYDFDDASLLTLAVKDEEKKGYLVLGYENGYIVKASVEELLDYSSREYSRYAESKLIFASIAKGNDAVLTISKEDKTKSKVVMRLDSLSKFDEGKLMDSGKLPYNEGVVGQALTYEIIPNEHIDFFSGILDKPKTTPGFPKNSNTKNMINKLHSWGINEI